MTITAVDSNLLGTSQVNASSSTSESSSYIDQDEFLSLFLAQLENQDPLDPMDTNELTSQLCSLSQLEQAQITNEYLEDLSLYESSINNSRALEFIGKTVAFSGDELSISNGAADDLGFELADDAAQVNISIYDHTGQKVKTIELGETSAGTNFQEWDGTDDDGEILSDGTYTFEIAAYDSDGDSVTATTYVMSEVTGINYQDGSVYLTTNDGEIAYGDVSWVSQS